MGFSWDRYYGLMKRLSSFVGLWPYQNKSVRLFRMGVTTAAALAMNVPQICKFVYCDKDLECIFGTVPAYILVLLILLKLHVGNWKISKIRTLADCMFVDWEKLQDPKEYKIMKTYVASARWIVTTYFAVCLTSCIVFISVSLIPRILDIALPLNESRSIVLPFEAYYFVDEREYFYYIFFQAIVIADVAIMGLIAHDSMFMTFVEHVCGVFAVAGFRFERLVRKDNDAVGLVNDDTADMYNKRMACSVNAHWAALEFAKNLENIFSISFGAELLLVTLVMSITLFQITLQSDDIFEAARYIIYVFAQLVHLFIFCWEGQRLIDHSLLMRDKIYSSAWYKIPAKSQRLILHVLKRSLHPKNLTAGKMFVFSLQGFTTVVQTSMSYFAVLSSIQ